MTLLTPPVKKSFASLEPETKTTLSTSAVARLILEFVVCMVLIVGTLEFCFSVAGIGEQEVLHIDKEQGFAPFSDKKVCWRKEGFSRTIYDNWGIPGTGRKIGLEKKAGLKRIAVVGDSYVEAIQVKPEKTACLRLEQKLNQEVPQEPVEVLNFGVQAHNIGQTYIRLKDYVINFKPDLVIVPIRPFATYLLPPNITDGFLGARPNFYINKHGKLTEDRTVQNIWLQSRSGRRMMNSEWVRKNSRLYGVFAKSMESIETWKCDGGMFGSFFGPISASTNKMKPLPANTSDKAIAFWWPVADALLKSMEDVCEVNGSCLVVVRLPGVNGDGSPVETALLEQSVQKNGIKYIDSTSDFQIKIKDGQKLFYDTHFNEEGNETLAESLFAGLKDWKISH